MTTKRAHAKMTHALHLPVRIRVTLEDLALHLPVRVKVTLEDLVTNICATFSEDTIVAFVKAIEKERKADEL